MEMPLSRNPTRRSAATMNLDQSYRARRQSAPGEGEIRQLPGRDGMAHRVKGSLFSNVTAHLQGRNQRITQRLCGKAHLSQDVPGVIWGWSNVTDLAEIENWTRQRLGSLHKCRVKLLIMICVRLSTLINAVGHTLQSSISFSFQHIPFLPMGSYSATSVQFPPGTCSACPPTRVTTSPFPLHRLPSTPGSKTSPTVPAGVENDSTWTTPDVVSPSALIAKFPSGAVYPASTLANPPKAGATVQVFPPAPVTRSPAV